MTDNGALPQTAEAVALESMEKDLLRKTEKWRQVRDTNGNIITRVTAAQVIDAFWTAKEKLDHTGTHSELLGLMLEKLFKEPRCF